MQYKNVKALTPNFANTKIVTTTILTEKDIKIIIIPSAIQKCESADSCGDVMLSPRSAADIRGIL